MMSVNESNEVLVVDGPAMPRPQWTMDEIKLLCNTVVQLEEENRSNATKCNSNSKEFPWEHITALINKISPIPREERLVKIKWRGLRYAAMNDQTRIRPEVLQEVSDALRKISSIRGESYAPVEIERNQKHVNNDKPRGPGRPPKAASIGLTKEKPMKRKRSWISLNSRDTDPDPDPAWEPLPYQQSNMNMRSTSRDLSTPSPKSSKITVTNGFKNNDIEQEKLAMENEKLMVMRESLEVKREMLDVHKEIRDCVKDMSKYMKILARMAAG